MARTPLQWQLEERVEDLFDRGSLVVTGRAGSLYKALEKGGTTAIWLLIGNFPFSNTAISVSGQAVGGSSTSFQGSSSNQAVSGQSSERFVRRLQSLLVEPPVCSLLRYGVDSNGIPFCAIPMLEGQELLGGLQFPMPGAPISPFLNTVVVAEGQRRLFQCLRLVEELHRRNFICGDLSDASFWLDGGGNVAFTGLLGDYNPSASAGRLSPLGIFMAPEQESGGASDSTTDVYALAVLAYVLLSGVGPSGEPVGALGGRCLDPASIQPLSALAPSVGKRFDGVLIKALSTNPQDRYRNVGALFNALTTSSDNDPINSITVVNAGSDGGSKAQSVKGQDKSGLNGESTLRVESPSGYQGQFRITSPRIFIFGVGILGLLLPIAIILSWSGAPNTHSPEHALVVGVQGIGLKSGSDAVDSASNSKGQPLAVGQSGNEGAAAGTLGQQGSSANLSNARSFAEQKRRMQEFALSDDPLAHESMVEAAMAASFEVDRKLPEDGIRQRLRRLNQLHTEQILGEWLSSRRFDDIKHAYAAVLRVANPSVPIEGRKQLFESAYVLSSRISLQLLAAAMLDSSDPNAYSPLFVKMGSVSIKTSESMPNALALIAQHPEVGPKFQNYILGKVNQFSDKDVLWLIDSLSGGNDTICKELFRIAEERKLVSPLRMEFLKTLSRKPDLEPAILDVIRHGIAGTVSMADVQILGSWLDKLSERLLVLIAADSKVDEVVRAAFDMVSGKEISIEPCASVVRWMKKNPVKDRYRLGKVASVLAFSDVVTDTELKQAAEGLGPYVSGTNLLATMIPVAPIRLTAILVSRYKMDLGLTELVPLLDNSDPQIRILAVRALESYNDAAALRVILDAFDREVDPEVRKVYKEIFWSARQRG